MKTKRRYTFYVSLLMLGSLLFIQALQVKHVFAEVHHRTAHHATEQLIAYEVGCPICAYLIHQQPKHFLYSSNLLVKPVEQVLKTSPGLRSLGYEQAYYALLGNKSPPQPAV